MCYYFAGMRLQVTQDKPISKMNTNQFNSIYYNFSSSPFKLSVKKTVAIKINLFIVYTLHSLRMMMMMMMANIF